MATSPSTGGSQTVDRALEVLQQIVQDDAPVPLDELAGRVGLSRTVTYRLVRSLENAGFVEREPRLGGYTVAATFVSMSIRTANRFNVGRLMRPVMDKIVAFTGETTSFQVRNGMKRVAVEVAQGVHTIRRVIPVGEVLPLCSGESGRVLCSTLSDADLDSLLIEAAGTSHDMAHFREDTISVRETGYFLAVGLRTPDVGAISFAIPGPGPDGLLGALTVSGPAHRWTADAMAAAAPQIRNVLQASNATTTT
ncbi:IclR family transcriptional regulator [Nocardioides sp. NBC_00850]|uniref:IclR family transcriptional regulator n=1 Tax=Nocardioides sp. NBC_00850 TaxID=2976001 RepID=UPI00386DBA60|nr:IclR family transcriptional regulator [Nocardioides sp. NBC_00850]